MFFLIVNYNSGDLITRLLDSLACHHKSDCKVVIVNNSPEDKSIANLSNDTIKIIESKTNLGFGKACNLGLNWIAKQNNKSVVWLINPDAYFGHSSKEFASPVDCAIAFFKQYPEVSILGTAVYSSMGELDSIGGTFNPNTAALDIVDRLPENLERDYFKTDWVSGCSLLINLANFKRVPQFCDRFFLYYEDLDFCLRYSQQGHLVAATHLLKITHDTSTITNRNIIQKYRHITQSYLIYIEKYGSKQRFLVTNIRIFINTIRLLVFNSQQGLGKLIGIYEYWQNKR